MTNEDDTNERDDGILKIWSIRLKLAGHKIKLSGNKKL